MFLRDRERRREKRARERMFVSFHCLRVHNVDVVNIAGEVYPLPVAVVCGYPVCCDSCGKWYDALLSTQA